MYVILKKYIPKWPTPLDKAWAAIHDSQNDANLDSYPYARTTCENSTSKQQKYL